MVDLHKKTVLITGAGRRIGRQLALACAHAGAAVAIHYGHSNADAENIAKEIRQMGGEADLIQADFSQPEKALHNIKSYFNEKNNLFALVNNAAIFEPVDFADTTLASWYKHMDINLTMPFLLSQAFAKVFAGKPGRIINILDWRALRPGVDHFPYTISKAALASMTQSLARILAPEIQVNGLALGAILPPSDGNKSPNIIKDVPAGRWAELDELQEAFMFLLTAPDYITGEILHLDGGRHLV
jgi:NAD(P)-dependent dehydrogenase (short-subunit alcohol dehydrogenase family)